MEPWDAAAEAAERAEAASRRAREIADRLTRLARGRRPDVSDVQDAQEHADEAGRRARESLLRSIEGHERAARSHERAAAAHEEAARRQVGDSAEHEVGLAGTVRESRGRRPRPKIWRLRGAVGSLHSGRSAGSEIRPADGRRPGAASGPGLRKSS